VEEGSQEVGEAGRRVGPDGIIVRYSLGWSGYLAQEHRGGICLKRSSGLGERCTDATLNGARKATGSG
jgi:hypothetical protein